MTGFGQGIGMSVSIIPGEYTPLKTGVEIENAPFPGRFCSGFIR